MCGNNRMEDSEVKFLHKAETGARYSVDSTFFALLRRMLCPQTVRDNRKIAEVELKALCSLAKAHDLTPFVAAALSEPGFMTDPDTLQKMQNTIFRAVWRYEKLNHELERISRVLEQNGIDYMPLKGSVIRKYYPEPWMRTSCDIDILVHEEDLERMAELLIRELGYTRDEAKSIHHISMHAPNGVHLEPHFNLRENVPQLDSVLDEVWDNCHAADANSHRYLQSPDFLMFHIIAHMSYHFQSGGCGVKPFIDLYLLEKNLDYDRDKLMDFCTRAGIARFYECVRRVIDVWFNEAEHTEMTRRIEEFILSGGVYGTKSNHIAIQQERAGNKFHHILTRIFMPYKSLKIKYPILEKHPWMAPMFEVVRWVQMLCKKRLGTYRRELDMICNLSDERRNEIGQLLDDVGL